ncbi:MAG: RagB/SusD family nutrient uptake outer membrane protein, partial [Duncaniella sp.]|nr:RagB/SusD family nutrient uptake outer membrane protein [Duncaniella sp.]
MKKILGLLAAGCMLLTACDDQLDIKPLGKTTLDNVNDIETLLNQRWLISDPSDLLTVCDATYKRMTQLSTTMSNKNEVQYALVNYDETINRADLTPTDSKYATMYQYINYANVVISKTPGVTGDESQKPRIIAEAKILRAWFHFLLVNIYAKQYDETTADKLGGIPYVDNTNVQEQKVKLTVKEVYDRILEDCSDDVIANLYQRTINDPCRFGADFGYGVRARVLFQMKRYEEAMKYANLAMKINGEIEDRSSVASS